MHVLHGFCMYCIEQYNESYNHVLFDCMAFAIQYLQQINLEINHVVYSGGFKLTTSWIRVSSYKPLCQGSRPIL